MDSSSLQAFLTRVEQDPALQQKLREPGADPLTIAKEEGFPLTAEELSAAGVPRAGDLSDEDLEEVAGGRCFWSCCSLPLHQSN